MILIPGLVRAPEAPDQNVTIHNRLRQPAPRLAGPSTLTAWAPRFIRARSARNTHWSGQVLPPTKPDRWTFALALDGGLPRDRGGQPVSVQAARLATFATVARLHPVADWIWDQLIPRASMSAMPALRLVSSGRPL